MNKSDFWGLDVKKLSVFQDGKTVFELNNRFVLIVNQLPLSKGIKVEIERGDNSIPPIALEPGDYAIVSQQLGINEAGGYKWRVTVLPAARVLQKTKEGIELELLRDGWDTFQDEEPDPLEVLATL